MAFHGLLKWAMMKLVRGGNGVGAATRIGAANMIGAANRTGATTPLYRSVQASPDFSRVGEKMAFLKPQKPVGPSPYQKSWTRSISIKEIVFKGIFKCPHCELNFDSRNQLLKHFDNTHRQENKSRGEPSIPCYCGARFWDQADYVKHKDISNPRKCCLQGKEILKEMENRLIAEYRAKQREGEEGKDAGDVGTTGTDGTEGTDGDGTNGTGGDGTNGTDGDGTNGTDGIKATNGPNGADGTNGAGN